MKSDIPHHAVAAALLVAFLSLGACSQSQGTNPAVGSASMAQAAGADQAPPESSPAFDYSPADDTRSAQTFDPLRANPLAASLGDNQTVGFGAGKLLTFTYQQKFDCVIQSNDDRNYNGESAAVDALEMRYYECQIGAPSTIDPTGKSVKQTDPLYVLVPFFETNTKSPAFSPALGDALKKLFGFVPDAFKADPGVPVQCPAPKDRPASCTMHPLHIDLGPVLTALGKEPPKTKVYTPLVDHDHLLPDATIDQGQEWWQVIVVLVEDPKAWPNAQGTTGITSVQKLHAAQKNKQASADVPTNFFLFFSSKTMSRNGMPGMKT